MFYLYTHMHVSALPRSAHKDPINHIALRGFRQKIRPIIVTPEPSRLVIITCAPAHVPGLARQVGSRLVHSEDFLKRI